MSTKGIGLINVLTKLGFATSQSGLGGKLVAVIGRWDTQSAIARFDTDTIDDSYRFGWVEHADGKGRTDCNSWPEFLDALKEEYPR